MRITNDTLYDTRDLRRIFARALKEQDIQPAASKLLRIRVVYARKGAHGRGVTGWAYYGSSCSSIGTGMRIRIQPAWHGPVDPRSVAAVAMHEAAHLRGIKHRRMGPALLYCRESIAEWAAGWALRFREPAKKARPGDDQKRSHLEALALKAERKVARWTKRLRKLRGQIRYYSAKMAKAASQQPKE